MSDKIIPSLLTLPVELVYRILDHLDVLNILFSMQNICTRLNRIIDSYHRYQVNFSFVSQKKRARHVNSKFRPHLRIHILPIIRSPCFIIYHRQILTKVNIGSQHYILSK